MLTQNRASLILRLNLVFAFVGGVLVLWAYMREPSEPGSAIFFGFSILRLVLLLFVLALLLLILVLIFGLSRNYRQTQGTENQFVRLVNHGGILWISFLGIGIAYILLFLSDQQLGSLASYRGRLLPILWWFAVLSIQFSFLILSIRGVEISILGDHREVLIPSLIILIFLGLLLVIIALTRVGLTPDDVYWQEPGVPILLHQVLLAALAGVLFYLFMKRTNLEKSTRLDVIAFLGLWSFACLLWLNQPARLTWFNLEATAPNYQTYPFSDALVYDNTARQFLTGKPIPSDFWVKPTYSFFLAILHLFAGGNYRFLVSLQVICLAIIPAVAYLLTVRLSTRPAGVVVALLLILREHNALILSDVIQVSHVKLLLSDVFAMGFMVLLLWLFFHWTEKPGERRITPLVFGGVLSLLVLTRGHPIILLPFVLCAVLFVPFPRSYLRWEALALTVLGFMIPLLPWFWRNYELTGKIALQYPTSPYSAQMSNAYSLEPSVLDPQNVPARNPGESDIAYYDRLGKQAAAFALGHPDKVIKFISAHYFHNSIFSYIYLPYSFQIENVKEYVKKQPFWGFWRGELSFQGKILLFIHLGLIALGFGYLWKKHRHLAFVPLFFGIGYNLSVSVGRLSGWRFILPADWITLIYFGIGLMQFYQILRSVADRESKLIPQENKLKNSFQPLKGSSLIGFALVFLFIGIGLTKGQELFSQRFPVQSTQQLKEDFMRITNAMSSSITSPDLEDFLKTDGAVILYGQALHPYFLPASDQVVDSSWSVYYFWPNYRPRPFPRMIFNLNGPKPAGVVLPIDSPPASFPDGADVIVVGCSAKSGEIDALSVLIQGNPSIYYGSGSFETATCPFSESN